MSLLRADEGAVDPNEIASTAMLPRRERLADALACVYAMSESEAHDAAASSPEWNEREALLCWTDATGRARRFRTDSGHYDAAQAWEALVSHELVPLEWLDAELRRFETRALHRAVLDRAMTPVRLPHPHTLRACVLAAADASALVTVEALCAAAIDALAPWGMPNTARPAVRWVFDDIVTVERRVRYWNDPSARLSKDSPEREPWSQPELVPAAGAWGRASRALAALRGGARREAPASSSAKWRFPFAKLAFEVASDAISWEKAARDGALIPQAPADAAITSALAGASFADFTNPFEPLARVFALGYSISCLERPTVLLAVES